MNILYNELGDANVIVLAIDGGTPRFSSGLYDMLRQMSSIFGDTWLELFQVKENIFFYLLCGLCRWEYMMVGVTKWKYSQSAIDERQGDCEYYGDPSDQCKNEAWFIREMSQQFQDKFDIARNFTFAFMDSFSQAGPAQNDQVQQEHWIEETSKLLKEATGKNETFDFKTIDDVLDENAACKEENIRLRDIIDEEIENLKEGVQHNADSISVVASTATLNSKHIDENSDEISLVSTTLTESINGVSEHVNKMEIECK